MTEHLFRAEPDYYAERAAGLLASARDGTGGAVEAFAAAGQPLTDDGARAVVAQRHGCVDWAELEARASALAAAPTPFARAFAAIEAHDVEGLVAELDAAPELVTAVGTNGNDLLGLATATCDERLVTALLERGADVARGNVHGWTPLHQTGYANLPALARLLLDAGAPADVSGRGDGGTPLVAALFWGHDVVAELLAGAGLAPGNLRVAAGLGRLDRLGELVPAPGRPTDAAGAHRGFYRPHSGFPAWTPSPDPQEILDEALTWAARNDRVGALDALVQRGARVDADIYRGTPLVWAAARGRAGAVRRLLALGADPSGRSTFGGPSHGEDITALHVAASHGDVPVVEALVEAGADTTARDALYDGDPAGWAEHNGQPEMAARLRT